MVKFTPKHVKFIDLSKKFLEFSCERCVKFALKNKLLKMEWKFYRIKRKIYTLERKF